MQPVFQKLNRGIITPSAVYWRYRSFFELGLLTVLAQFAAHEFAFLSWSEKGEIIGCEAHRDRFVDLLAKGFKWYAVSALLLILVLIPAGYLFFTQSPANSVDFPWRLPWALAVIGVGCNLLLIPFYAVITGSGEVASINRREMMGGMAGSIIGWLVIACGGGLYAIPAVMSGTILVGVTYLFRSKPRLVRTAFSHAFGSKRPYHTLSWKGEVWPMQWKIALSWVSGYFIFQLFTPVRAHKQEPMLLISIIGAILIGTSTFFLGVKYSSIGMAAGYSLITLLYGIPSTYYCLSKFKSQYQVC